MLPLSTRSLLLFLCSVACSLCADYDPIALYLTWQRNPDTTMTIQWITAFDRLEDTVEYHEAGEDRWTAAVGTHTPLPENTPYFLHRVELTGLKPATTYQFRTGQDAVVFKFKTMPSTLDKPITFVSGGDMYHDGVDVLHETNKQAAKQSPLFALVGGDIAYASDKKVDFLPRWTAPYLDKLFGQKFDRWLVWLMAWKTDMVTPEGFLIPMLPAIGNHDVSGRFHQTPEQAPFFYSLFPMPGPQGYNVLDFGAYMSIFLLDSDHTHPVEGKQTEWLQDALKARSAIPAKYALYHVPAYPSVHTMDEPVCALIRKNWTPLFDTYGLTAAFENHEHTYKRTHPILGGKIDPKGVLYIGDGGWGVDKARRPRHVKDKWYLAETVAARHFLSITLESGKQTVTAISSDGTVIDQFSW